MASTLLTMDAANLFVGDDDPTKSHFLTIKNVKIPSLEEKTKEHSGGGAVLSVQLGMRQIEALSLSFQLHGFNPDVMSRFMPSNPGRIKYTVRGNIRDARTHADLELRAIIEGRMIKYEPTQFEKDSGMDSEYEIREVMFYHLFMGGLEKFYVDYFAGPAGVRVNNIPAFDALARNLGIM